uniref:Uncharacterized protein n=1 Tax=Pithovirus LCDPAC02 TaxID=2506601 RepID=A0A481YQV9_9VIRU|nr:MAG: hypothetical protein LCDPAC02_00530 [Pithovirus LCDPAC02]
MDYLEVIHIFKNLNHVNKNKFSLLNIVATKITNNYFISSLGIDEFWLKINFDEIKHKNYLNSRDIATTMLKLVFRNDYNYIKELNLISYILDSHHWNKSKIIFLQGNQT